MKTLKWSSLVVFSVLAPAVLSLYAFTILGPSLRMIDPSGNLPFAHWDLREFPNCVVPYSLRDDTADVVGEFAAVDAAFAAWEAVNPAIIRFRRVGVGAGASCPGEMDGHNLIGWNASACPGPGDDVCLAAACACGAAIAAGAVIVGPGADGVVTTSALNQCPGGGDDVIEAGGNIVDGGNGIIETVPNALTGDDLGQTFVFYQAGGSGRILEADILFNDVSHTWVITANHASTPTQAEVQTVALHEIGHFLGLDHVPAAPDVNMAPFDDFPGPGDMDVDGDGVLDTPIMDSPTQTALHSLSDDDTDGVNFLYTPDLGDAPDPSTAFNRYPSLVHGAVFNRLLNGVRLFTPAEGAAHLFGFFGAGAVPRYQYEWLGTRIDDHSRECEARVTNRDQFDDGVTFGGRFLGSFEPGGAKIPVTMRVSTAADLQGRRHTYEVANPMYLNGWFDWNADGDWDDAGEHEIGTGTPCPLAVLAAGNYTCDVDAPAGARSGGYSRFRLDYREDVGQARATDPTLMGTRGAAQFGEVEDYPIGIVRTVVQLHLYGPVPNQVPVGTTATINASVQSRFDGVPGARLVFTKLSGALTFTSGVVSSDGTTARVTADGNGAAVMTFVPTGAGPALVRVSVVGTSFTAYAFFRGV